LHGLHCYSLAHLELCSGDCSCWLTQAQVSELALSV